MKSEMFLYDEKEIKVMENFILNNFGKFDDQVHEILSDSIHNDICIINPTEEKNFYTLMGAFKMDLPSQVNKEFSRCELVITLPPQWNINSKDQKDYWPVTCLKNLSQFPYLQKTWLGYGHTIKTGNEPLEGTGFTNIILTNSYNFMDINENPCILPNGEKVNFFQIIPIYDEELNIKEVKGSEELLTILQKNDVTHYVDQNRKNYGEKSKSLLSKVLGVLEI